MYIADSSNNRIRKVTVSTGIISTIAGTGTSSYSGDNGAATSTGLSVYGVALDSSGTISFCLRTSNRLIHCTLDFIHPGNVYVADYSNYRIRKVALADTYGPR